jgi:hypothetical protein
MPMRYRTMIEACPCPDHFLQGGCYGKPAILCRHLHCPDPNTALGEHRHARWKPLTGKALPGMKKLALRHQAPYAMNRGGLVQSWPRGWSTSRVCEQKLYSPIRGPGSTSASAAHQSGMLLDLVALRFG